MAGFDPLYSGIAKGLSVAGVNIAKGIEYRSKKGRAKDIFDNIISNLDKELNPPEVAVDPTTGQPVSHQQISEMMKQGQDWNYKTPDVNQQNAFNILYKGLAELDPYSDVAPNYQGIVKGYYDANMPKEEIFNIDPTKTTAKYNYKTKKMDILYQGTPKEQELRNIGGGYPIKLNDGSYKLAIDTYDPKENGYKTQYIRDLTQSEIDDYEKSLLDESSSSRRTRGIKTPKLPETYSGQEMLLKTDIDNYAKLKQMNWEQMSPEQKAEYQTLHDRIAQKTQQDPDELTNYVYSEEFTSKNRTGKYGDVIAQRKTDIQGQFDFVGKEYDKLIELYNNGQMDFDKAKQYALDLYNQNINNWYPEVKNWLLDLLKSFGVDVKQ